MEDFLMHEGKPRRSGRYPWGSGERPYQSLKIGVRRYQNKDGSLTKEGQKRYDREVMKNNLKKRKDRADEESLNDPNRWVKEDLEKTKQALDSSSDMIRAIKKIEKDTRPKPKKERMDLSHMTDQEMRQKINRELIERQYNDLFGETNPSEISKGREYVSTVLDIAGTVIPLSASALSIALAIKSLKG